MLQQEVMIEKVRELCERYKRVVAALMYGSFTLGQGDRFSDIEYGWAVLLEETGSLVR